MKKKDFFVGFITGLCVIGIIAVVLLAVFLL